MSVKLKPRRKVVSDDYLKLMIIVFVVLFWIALTLSLILFFSNSADEDKVAALLKKDDSVKSKDGFEETQFTCEDLDYSFAIKNNRTDICYRPRTKTLEFWITNTGDANIIYLNTNVIGMDAIVYWESNVTIKSGQSGFISIPYDVDINDLIEIVEVVPIINLKNDELGECPNQKILYSERLLSCRD